MRIISGKKKGIVLNPPDKLPARPSTEKLRESIFSMLNSYFHFEMLEVADLFAGTGAVSFEFASRGCRLLDAVDINSNCVSYIRETATKYQFDKICVHKSDVLKFLSTHEKSYDIIFADPPYNYSHYPEIIELVFTHGRLKKEGWLLVEHSSELMLPKRPEFMEMRKYGQTRISIFTNQSFSK